MELLKLPELALAGVRRLNLLDVSPDVLNLLLDLEVCTARKYATDDCGSFLHLCHGRGVDTAIQDTRDG